MKLELVLSIEAAVGGGSLALLAGDRVVSTWYGDGSISRSEELLPRLAELLDRSVHKREDLTRIAVANGPGSYTGIRIGIATAMGLARALGIPCVGVGLLRALASRWGSLGDRTVVVPIGRSGYCWQYFKDRSAGGPVETGNLSELAGSLLRYSNAMVIAQSDAFQDLGSIESLPVMPDRIIDIGRDLAIAVGLASDVDDGLQPFYAREIRVPPSQGVSN